MEIVEYFPRLQLILLFYVGLILLCKPQLYLFNYNQDNVSKNCIAKRCNRSKAIDQWKLSNNVFTVY